MLQSLKQYYAIMHQLKTCITIYEWKLILPWLIVPLGSCACSLCTVCSRKENNVKMAEEAKDFAKWMYSFFFFSDKDKNITLKTKLCPWQQTPKN